MLFLVSKDITKDKLLPIATKQEIKYANPPDAKSQTVKTILEINGERYETEIKGKTSVYDFMDKLRGEGKINFTAKNYIGMGKFIEEINGLKNDGNKYWIYAVNSKEAQVGVSNYQINPGDVVSWTYGQAY